MRSLWVLFFVFAACSISAQSTPAPSSPNQSSFDRLTQSNHDLLELLKKQQAVLEDLQADNKRQSRQIQSLEERLSDALQENAHLQDQIETLKASPTSASASTAAAQPPASQVTPAPPPPPSTYLPPPESEGAPGTLSWHRLFTLSGGNNKTSDIFHIQGKQWRVLWHNLDGSTYQNTSALFINAFPKDDTIPQKVCAKLGTGGDSTELIGPGNYYLKIEASGGKWELAVEDFR